MNVIERGLLIGSVFINVITFFIGLALVEHVQRLERFEKVMQDVTQVHVFMPEPSQKVETYQLGGVDIGGRLK